MKRLFLICGMLAMIVVFSVPALAQEETGLEETTGLELTAQQEATTESEPRQAQGDEAAVEEQYEEEGDNSSSQGQQAPDEGCQNPQPLGTTTGTENQRTSPFSITGNTFRIVYETEPAGEDPFLPTVDVSVLNQNGQPIGEGFLAFEGEDGSENILAGPGVFQLEIRAEEASYAITVEDCAGTTQDQPGGDNDDGNDNDASDSPDDGIPDDVMVKTIPEKSLANTGGPGLLLPVSALMVGVGVLGFAVIRRR